MDIWRMLADCLSEYDAGKDFFKIVILAVIVAVIVVAILGYGIYFYFFGEPFSLSGKSFGLFEMIDQISLNPFDEGFRYFVMLCVLIVIVAVGITLISVYEESGRRRR